MTPSQLLDIQTATCMVALRGGDDVYLWWGDDKTVVSHRSADVEIVMIGASLDTETWLIEPSTFPALYYKLVDAIGHGHIHMCGRVHA